MGRRFSVVRLAVVLTMLSGAVAVPVASGATPHARKYSFHMTSDCPATGENIKGTVKINQPFGNGTCRGTLEVPITKVTLGLKGGTLSYESVGKVVGATFQSKWHITKGTGEFKGASGSGNATGTLDGRATLIGTVRF